MPYLRATITGDIPGRKLSAAISRFCSAVQPRRRSRPVINSMRRLRLLVRSVVGASPDSNATAITLSSFLKDNRWPALHRVPHRADATSLPNLLKLFQVDPITRLRAEMVREPKKFITLLA